MYKTKKDNKLMDMDNIGNDGEKPRFKKKEKMTFGSKVFSILFILLIFIAICFVGFAFGVGLQLGFDFVVNYLR
jgi:hypothetical protein